MKLHIGKRLTPSLAYRILSLMRPERQAAYLFACGVGMATSPIQTKSPVFAPSTVRGYHGCAQEVAKKILSEDSFLPSNNAFDWLGAGIYFWEYAPYRALDWASKRWEEPAVIGVTLKLGRCLNLLDIANASGLLEIYQQIASNLSTRRMPRNTTSGAHFLDREVIDTYCRMVSETNDNDYQTVRGCFPEGEPLFPGSKILNRAHVQIAVRDPSCIARIHQVAFPSGR